MSPIGPILRKIRKDKGLSLREAADRSQLSHSYIRYLEIGKRPGTDTPINPTPDTLKRLSIAYDYSYSELLKLAGYIENGANPNDENDDLDEEYRIIERFARTVSKKDRRKAIKILEATFEEAFDEDDDDDDL
jgi:transcriptional regulator with XRE-family HTH domain